MNQTSENDPQFGIEELAERGGVSRRTVRYYVQRGLLPAPTGTGRGPHYTKDHLDTLIRVRQLQEAGVSLSEIPVRLGYVPNPPGPQPGPPSPDPWPEPDPQPLPGPLPPPRPRPTPSPVPTPEPPPRPVPEPDPRPRPEPDPRPRPEPDPSQPERDPRPQPERDPRPRPEGEPRRQPEHDPRPRRGPGPQTPDVQSSASTGNLHPRRAGFYPPDQQASSWPYVVVPRVPIPEPAGTNRAVWTHIVLADGLELHVREGRSAPTPAQLVRLEEAIREILGDER